MGLLLILLISLTVYIVTLCPTVYVGDSGELITACFHLGVPHPPGYPLYCILGKVFTLLPFANIACRVNLASALLAALSVSFLYLL